MLHTCPTLTPDQSLFQAGTEAVILEIKSMSIVFKTPCYVGLKNKIGFYKKIYVKNIVSSSICYQPKLESSTTLYFSEFPLSVRYYSVTEQDTQGGYIPAIDHVEVSFSETMDEMIDEKSLRQLISEDAEDDDLYDSELKRLGIAQEDINRLSRFEPLTPNAKNLIITACGSGEIICIKKFLERNLLNEDFNSASWLEILWAIYHIRKKEKIEWKHISNIPQIIDELSDHIKQKCSSHNDYINEQFNKMKYRPFFKAQMESQKLAQNKSAGAEQELTKTITKKKGRPQKYSPEIIEAMKKAYQDKYSETNDSKGAWSYAAEFGGAPTGDAARIACANYKKNN